MSRPLALLFASAVIAAAQPASPLAANATAIAPISAAASPSVTAPARAVSSEMAGRLRASLPKLAPVKTAEVKSAAEAPDLREIDKPRNDIVRLPNYVVRERKPPVFTERDLWGDRVFGDRLARKYYPEWYLAFNKVAMWTPLAFFMASARASALLQYEEDERLRRMAEFADLTNMVMRSNPTEGAKVRSLTQEMFMHQPDFGWQGSPAKQFGRE